MPDRFPEVPFSLPRRALLRAGLAALGSPLLAREAWAALQAPAMEGGLIVRSAEPRNLEMPFAELESYLVPAERFFVRNHFAQPRIEAGEWRLRVEGAVRRELALTYDELRRMPVRKRVVTLECAGNGRSFLNPAVKGVQWAQGAVGNAEWEGVPLAAVLERAGLRPEAVEVVLQGADRGEIKDEPKPAGPIHFARSVPLDKARRDVLLALRMNGADLPPAHGFPVRAVVPGWYGVASVKWLTHLRVVDRPFRGHFQSIDYTVWDRGAGEPALNPIQGILPKAQIARPSTGEALRAGSAYRVFGAAWAGEEAVERVEVSADGGRTWSPARLLDPAAPFAWRRWEYPWTVPARPGATVLMARATDARGRTQPTERDPDRRNYLVSHVLPITVDVR